MKTSITRRAGQLVTTLAVLSALGGCAVYTPAPDYYGNGGVVYVSPPPIYVAPPVYAGPPVFFNFSFRSWGGHGHYRGGGWHGGRGRGYRR